MSRQYLQFECFLLAVWDGVLLFFIYCVPQRLGIGICAACFVHG